MRCAGAFCSFCLVLFVGKGEATGDVCHCRMVRIRIACSSCRRPPCGKVTIYLRNGKREWEKLLMEVGEGNVKCTITVYDNCDNKDNKDNRQ